MFRNIFFDNKTSKIHIWETIKNNNMFDSIEWSPYIFENDPEGKIKTVTGKTVSRKDFLSYSEYQSYCTSNTECYENQVRPDIQFLVNRYYGIDDDVFEVPKLRIYSIDIEVHSTTGDWSGIDNALYPVTCCSIHDNIENKTTTYGIKPYNGEYKDKDFLKYVYCNTEEQLLTNIFNHFQKKPPDVITGWNVIDFDIMYLINRAKNVFGEETSLYRKLSPIGIVRSWKSKSGGMNIDVAGVTLLDYMQLYKWYSPSKLEKYSLDFVSTYELQKGKVDYSAEYEDLRELYNNDWDLYIKYNITDSLRVAQLEEKLGYIKLVQALSLLCKAPMKYYNAMTQLIEGLMLTHFRRKGKCAPRFLGGHQEHFEAAFVKEPIVGRYDWVVDLDIVSSYPTAIITMNMSPETYYGSISGFTEQEIIHNVRKKKFSSFSMITSTGNTKTINGDQLETFNKALEKKLLCIAPCGSVFTTSKVGVLAEVVRHLFDKRVEIKGKMIKLKKSLPDLRGDNALKAKERIAQLHSLQWALKIIANAVFGITAVPYSRYFNHDIAKAIVSCGRVTRAAGEYCVNELLNGHNEDLQKILDQIKGEYNGLHKNVRT